MATSGNKTVTVTSWNKLKFSWSVASQSVANNTSTVSWSLQLISTSDGRIDSSASKTWKVNVAGSSYSGTNTVGISNNSSKVLASGTTVIKHNADGTKSFNYSFSQEFDITFSGKTIGTISGSGSGTLNTIPRKSVPTLSASTVEMGKTLTIYTNRASDSFTHKLYYGWYGTQYYSITTGVGTSYTWTVPLSFANNIPDATKGWGTIRCETYNGSTLIGTADVTFTATVPASMKPSCSLTVSDPTGNLATYGNYVKGLSKFAVTIGTTISYGSSIKSYSSTANGGKYTAASFTTGFLKSSGTLSIATTVTDKRGRTGTASKSLTVLNYTAPTITKLTVGRCNSNGTPNDQGDHIQVTFSATVTALNNKNTATYKLKYKKSAESAFTEKTISAIQNTYSVNNYGYVFAADTDSSYVVELDVADNHGSAARATTASTAFTLVHFGPDGTSIGLGKLAEMPWLLDIGLKVRFAGGLLPPVIPPETNLNDVRTPNTYIGGDLNTYQYANCPIEGGTFTLEVLAAGELGQVKQRIQTCSKEISKTFERYYHTGSWGSWFCVSDYAGTLLWEGEWYMKESQTANLSDSVSQQKNGIVLVFTEYINGASGNSAFHTFFVPKMQVSLHPGKGYTFILSTGKFGFMAAKYLYINNTNIVGHTDNDATGTGGSGITYTNNRFVLRYVIGV